ncbi:MAG: SGNH/GDSL hydrolase family protein, partial [Candidatus Aenigmatarchaeota archaeon]
MKMGRKYDVFVFVILLLTGLTSFGIVNDFSLDFNHPLGIMKIRNGQTDSCPCTNYGEGIPLCDFSDIFTEPETSGLESILDSNISVILDGSSVCIPSYIVNTNSHGFRDKEYDINGDNETFRIVISGDSMTFGQGVNTSETYSSVLERKLNKNKNINFDVLNLGVPGYNIDEKAEFLIHKGLKFEPDIIILQYNKYDVINKTKLRSLIKEEKRNILDEEDLSNKTLDDTLENKIDSKASWRGHQRYFEKLRNLPFSKKWDRVENSFK